MNILEPTKSCNGLININHFYFSKDYVDLLFKNADKVQRLQLNENEANLLKLVGFFASGKCPRLQMGV